MTRDDNYEALLESIGNCSINKKVCGEIYRVRFFSSLRPIENYVKIKIVAFKK